MGPEPELSAFGRALSRRQPPLCPEMCLWLLADHIDLESACSDLRAGEAPPYWAFCWGSGQLLARVLLDHPEEVRGRRVVDLGAGSGVVAIAAAMAGAAGVVAVDNDPAALEAVCANAVLNAVDVDISPQACSDWDVLLASDVWFEAGPRAFVQGACSRGRSVLSSEPDRPGAIHPQAQLLLRARSQTLPDVDSPTLTAAIYRLAG